MNDAQKRDVELFAEALPLSAAQRAAYLEKACSNDPSLRRRVEQLLRAHEELGDFLEQQPLRQKQQRPKVAGEKPGDRIDHYRLLQQIGEGGCGVVYMAEQEWPVRRRVAVKIIKPGMDTKSVMARFEAERQALALMDHPNIAKVFDAGSTESGRPYFVMELVRGAKITDYCDLNSLGTEERLRLFIQVCRAVQHAHQKGIIHRDIKPSNILVTKNEEGEPLPVVIDFGIAKATSNHRLTDKTLFTAFEMLIGTPAYMSPEQAELSSVDVDTRTDIYSLGVLLYELLTASTPFDGEALMKAGLDEIRRVIREKEPERPSTRLNTMSPADLTKTAQRRGSTVPTLIRSIRGDLDWIVMKALEKNRTRRYETANGLALDIQRYLANEPISARPPSTGYKLYKTVQRHKLICAGIAIMLALMVVSLAVISALLAREREARREAEGSRRQAELHDKRSVQEAFRSRQITRFLEDMLKGVGPSVARGRDTTMLREVLEKTAQRIGNDIVDQPDVEAELRNVVGQLYLEIGNYSRAEEMHRAALSIYQRIYLGDCGQSATTLNDLGAVLWKEGKLTEAEGVSRQALGMQERLFGHESEDVATSLVNLSDVYRRHGRHREAKALAEDALNIRQKLFGNDSLKTADALRSLAILSGDENNYSESEVISRRVLAIRRARWGNDDLSVASSLVDVAWAVGANGKLEEAEVLEREALSIRRKLLDENTFEVAKSLYLVGDRLRQRGRLVEAKTHLLQALQIQQKVLAADNPAILDSLHSLGLTLAAQGLYAQSESVHRDAFALWQKRGDSMTPQGLTELQSLAEVLLAQSKFDEADVLLRIAPNAGLISLHLELLARQGRWIEATADARRALDLQSDNHERYHTLAALLAIMHDRTAYDQLCQQILAAFGNTTNPYVADRMAKDCLLLPSNDLDLNLLTHLADTAVSAGKNEVDAPFFQICKALVEYRQGHFTEALEWGERSLKVPAFSPRGQAQAYAVLALAHAKLGNSEQARTALLQGEQLAPTDFFAHPTDDKTKDWLAWIFARVTLDEAHTLLIPVSQRAQ